MLVTLYVRCLANHHKVFIKYWRAFSITTKLENNMTEYTQHYLLPLKNCGDLLITHPQISCYSQKF